MNKEKSFNETEYLKKIDIVSPKIIKMITESLNLTLFKNLTLNEPDLTELADKSKEPRKLS